MLLCGALAIHVMDEALTGFLSVYNPTVIEIKSSVPGLPLPVFSFEVWLGGLVLAVIGLSLLTRFVAGSAPWARAAAYIVAVIMLANALGHTAGTIFGRTTASVEFLRPMPGFYSSPLIAAAAILLLVRLRSSRQLLSS